MNPVLDTETEILKKEFFDYLADLEVMRSMRYQDFATVLLIEPDKGFDNGSDLKNFAHIIRDELRTSDIIGRLNHVRFGIILPHTDLQSSFMAGERLRKRVEDYLFSTGHKHTISLGGSCFPTNVTTSDNLVSIAEEMLKKAKDKGGNTICFPQ